MTEQNQPQPEQFEGAAEAAQSAPIAGAAMPDPQPVAPASPVFEASTTEVFAPVAPADSTQASSAPVSADPAPSYGAPVADPAPSHGTAAADPAPAVSSVAGDPAPSNGANVADPAPAYGTPVADPAPAYGAPAAETPVAPAWTAPAFAGGHAASAPQHQTLPTTPLPESASFAAPHAPASHTGAAFGIPAGEHMVQPAKRKEKKKSGAGRVVAILAAAAVVGAVAGFGGDMLSDRLFPNETVAQATGSGAITVNNPGSVNQVTAIATQALPSVVTVQVSSSSASGSGSGVVISADGYVVTNAHVVTLDGAASQATIRATASDGRIYQAKVVGVDTVYDVAVIKLQGASGLTPMTFADSSTLNVGDTTVALGAPLGLQNTVTEGIVSALNRSIQVASSAAPKGSGGGSDQGQGGGSQGDSPFRFDIPGQSQQTAQSATISIAVIQTDAAINPGNSGGALVNSKGQLIGINVAIATAGGSSSGSGAAGSIGVGFAIPSNIVQRIANEIIKNGSAGHGLLGATVASADSQQNATNTGALIREVTAGGAAQAAGLQAGDVVTGLAGVPISNSSDLTAQVRSYAPGSQVEISYLRDGKEHTAKVTLGTLTS